MITCSDKTGKNRAEMRTGSILALIFNFFLTTVHILVLLLLLLPVYRFLDGILPPSDFDFHGFQCKQIWAFYSKLLFSFPVAKNRLN